MALSDYLSEILRLPSFAQFCPVLLSFHLCRSLGSHDANRLEIEYKLVLCVKSLTRNSQVDRSTLHREPARFQSCPVLPSFAPVLPSFQIQCAEMGSL